MDIIRVNGQPTERHRRARKHRHVRPAQSGEDAASVRGGVREGGVAVDGADASEAEGRVLGGEEDGERVLLCGKLLSGILGE